MLPRCPSTRDFDKFTLIGNYLPFRVVRFYLVGGEILAVHGVTLDGKRQTTARVVDVYPID